MSTVSSLATSAHSRAASASSRSTVHTADGVALEVRIHGPRRARLTVVLSHGHCGRSESWTAVRSALLKRYPDARIVCYDHRGHGRSALADRRTYTLAQLADDLHAVLEAVAPTGPVILVGHSMGGMSVLTYVSRHPHEIGSRITGIGLIATAASSLTEDGLGRFLRHPLISLFRAAVHHAPGRMHHAKLLAGRAFAPIVHRARRGDHTFGPRLLTLANAMHNQTPIVTMAAFLEAFTTYDRTDALATLSAIPTLILCGSTDSITPPTHSIAMAAAVDYSDLVLVEGAGHSVIMEQPGRVADALTRLLTRAHDTHRNTGRYLPVAV
ncbi:alpha/beta fold hydrolase [Nocardia seriolae]|uniref:Prolyl aminopeptidase n=1 Tax=Nocardia seriolae TaxID=37332 RepID=A0ABC8B062_9NOCA|nr:alpha/beta hydrolase [Nocardia seriolae]APA99959.1 Prolyl aminopeptidase [Nocardia seriolae]MTJ64644.1 alpha/beta fold hydrolase [Nocardia seriolae]MTJ73045.1 alpha/beta fold hydrolase [Nocardia seriolae]MTJ89486.1 alpha/beta fold hydrolase [Nocardia seriolae]MTK33462.1 alpha/beta fold hydrolase [Nocardia seriolae]